MSKQGAIGWELAQTEIEDEEADRFEEQALHAITSAARDLAGRGWTVEQIVGSVAEALAPEVPALSPADEPPL